MPNIYQAKQVAAKKPLAEPTSAVHPVVLVGEFIVPAGLAVNDVIEMAGIPAYTVPCRQPQLMFDDCDSNGTPTIKFDCGIMTGRAGDGSDNTRTVGTEFLSADTTAQAGGMVQGNQKAGLALLATSGDRGVGLKVQTAAATLIVGARIRIYLECLADPSLLT
jgi:hypothetical protein